MALILVTGISTSGKSTVAGELQKLGYEAYDTEHNGISAWYNKVTGEKSAEFGEMPERTPEWLNQHKWLMSFDWVKRMAIKAKHKPIFLCGGAANELEIGNLCDKVIWLKTDEATIRQRVLNPRDHDYGTRLHELEAAIEGNKRKESDYLQIGTIFVDATKPIKEVVDEILTISAV